MEINKKIILVLFCACVIFSLMESGRIVNFNLDSQLSIAEDEYTFTEILARKPSVIIASVKDCVVGPVDPVNYISRVSSVVMLAVLHESLKNIKQFPRCAIDSRTDVRYN